MRLRLVLTLATGAALFTVSTGHAAMIAVTEFIIDPYGADETAPEWIELFNYGSTSADLTGWTIKDNSSSAFTFPSFTIPSGGYAIVARDHTAFVNRWLGGVDDARVVPGSSGFVMNNSAPGDGLYLRDNSGALVWSLGYNISAADPTSPYHATFLAIDDFTVTDYGTPPQDGTAKIVRNGLDATGALGYQDNTASTDPFAYFSTANTGSTEFGSPLLGSYTAVPEPSGLSLLAAAGILAARRRRK